uniref:START domain-containing protein 1 n=1 Tax=Erpetoichthys calabaricus TaxID=27687 RepID=A0A8C4T486_ERPCA
MMVHLGLPEVALHRKHPSIHPFSNPLNPNTGSRGSAGANPSQHRAQGREPILGRVPTHRRTHTNTPTHQAHTRANLESPIHLTSMSLDCGRKPERPEETHTNGDTVSSKVIPEVGKVFKLEAVLDATPKQLYSELFEKLEEISTWNPNVSRIQKIDQNTMVTHEVTSLTPGNLIGQRDFVSIRHCWRQDSVFCLAGAAIQIESLPPQNGFVRAEDGPSCIIVKPLGSDKSHFTWLLNMDLKGWLPKSLVNQALPQAQADFVKHLRKKLSMRITSGQR